MDQLTTSDAGIIGGAITMLGGFWKFLRWLIGKQESAATLREKKLDAWEAKLQTRDEEYHVMVERRLAGTEKKLAAVSAALFATISEVQLLESASPVLARARMILQTAYPVPADMPEDIAVLIHRLGGTL